MSNDDIQAQEYFHAIMRYGILSFMRNARCCTSEYEHAYQLANVLQAAPGRAGRGGGPAREAIVFMIGGGNYIEYDSLQAWAQRSQPAKSIVYGSTDLPTGESFVKQLADLGRLTPR